MMNPFAMANNRLTGIFSDVSVPQGTGLDPVRDAKLAMAAQLMQSSPYKSSFGEVFSKALMAGNAAKQQARQQSMQEQQQAQEQELRKAQIQQMQQQQRGQFGSIDPDQFTPESLARFQQSGNYGDLKPRDPMHSDTADIQNWQFFQSLTPEQQKQWMSLQRQPTAPILTTVNGVPTLVDRFTNQQTPLTNLPAQLSAEQAMASGTAQAKATGQAQGEAQGAIIKKGIGAGNVLDIVNIAEPLIDVATGSGVGAATDAVAGFFGKSLSGAQAIAQLRVLEASLILSQPRMEGPQSNADAQRYEQAAAQIGSATVPRKTKLAALKTIRDLQTKYQQAAGAQSGGWKIEPVQ